MQQDYIPTEFLAGHAGGPVSAALSNVIRCAHFALSEVGPLVACTTWSWRDSQHMRGGDAVALSGQIGGSWQTWTPFFRQFVAIPKGCSQLRARVILALSPSAGRVVWCPRIAVDIGGGTVRASSVRALTVSDMTVTSGTAVLTLEAGHGVSEMQTLYTSGFSANIAESSAALVQSVTDTTITVSFATSDGSKGSGIAYVPAEVVCDTTEAYNAPEYTEPSRWLRRHEVYNPKPELVTTGYYLPADLTPFAGDVVVDLQTSDTASASVRDVRVDVRARWDVLGVYVPGVPTSVARRIAPLAVLVYAVVDEGAYSVDSLEWSAGEPITSTLCTRVNQEITAAVSRPLTHTNVGFGGFGASAWDNYPAMSDGSRAGGSIGANVRPNAGTATSVTLYSGEVYLEWQTDLQVGFTFFLVDPTTTWTVSVTIGGVTTTFPWLTGTGGASETTGSVSSVPSGWQSVSVSATQTGGSSSYFDLRHFRVVEVGSAGQPADD